MAVTRVPPVAAALLASALLCAALAALVRVEVPVDLPVAAELVAEAPDTEPHGLRYECDDARIRAAAYLEEEIDHDDFDAMLDARRWIDQGFRAMGCATPWSSGEDPQLACDLSGCGGAFERMHP
jgi:hypothetical protein